MNGIISKGGKPVKETIDSDDKPTVKKVVKMLKKSSQVPSRQYQMILRNQWTKRNLTTKTRSNYFYQKRW